MAVLSQPDPSQIRHLGHYSGIYRQLKTWLDLRRFENNLVVSHKAVYGGVCFSCRKVIPIDASDCTTVCRYRGKHVRCRSLFHWQRVIVVWDGLPRYALNTASQLYAAVFHKSLCVLFFRVSASLFPLHVFTITPPHDTLTRHNSSLPFDLLLSREIAIPTIYCAILLCHRPFLHATRGSFVYVPFLERNLGIACWNFEEEARHENFPVPSSKLPTNSLIVNFSLQMEFATPRNEFHCKKTFTSNGYWELWNNLMPFFCLINFFTHESTLRGCFLWH